MASGDITSARCITAQIVIHAGVILLVRLSIFEIPRFLESWLTGESGKQGNRRQENQHED